MMSSNATAHNWTFVVSSTFPCTEVADEVDVFPPDPVWRTTYLGCRLLLVLQDMYKFHMTYEDTRGLLRADNTTYPDIYAKPMPSLPYIWERLDPIYAIIDRRYGFILRSTYKPMKVRAFYTLPFTRGAWYLLTLMTYFIITPLLYFLSRWEEKVVPSKQERSMLHELMVVFGASCQHIPPVNPILQSRRSAYFLVFMYTWIVYTYYSSNLLSHLVNDKERSMTLVQMVESDYQFLMLDSLMKDNALPWYIARYEHHFSNMNLVRQKVHNTRVVNISTGLKAIGSQQVALFSDFVTIYPHITEYLNNEVICDLVEINLYSNIKKFLYTSKHFPLKEQFKIGMLKLKESGFLKRMKRNDKFLPPKCQQTPESVATLQHVVGPLLVLLFAFALSVVMLFVERAVYERNRVWPYVD